MNEHKGEQAVLPANAARWTKESLNQIAISSSVQMPEITAAQSVPMTPELDVWDSWPLSDPDGTPVTWRNGELWFALAVERSSDPESRHDLARIHHFHRKGDYFEHLGATLPEGSGRGARQWSGSALYEDGKVTLYFTAAGYAKDTHVTFHQRIFMTSTVLSDVDVFGGWSDPVELFVADGEVYQPANQEDGIAGKIKAFRDPSHYRDESGEDYILFTGSCASEPGTHNGLIGLAKADAEGAYRLLPPIITATGTSNELERPHIVKKDGRLYMFWSTQRGVFDPGISAPTGMYGATATSIEGPWELLNGHGLVAANPIDFPTQAYSWWVLPDLSVTSFVDYWGPEDNSSSELETRRARFGGTFAPFFQIELDGTTTRIVG